MASTSTAGSSADAIARRSTISFDRAVERKTRDKRTPRVNLARESLTRAERKQIKYTDISGLYPLWLEYAGGMLREGRENDDRLTRMDWLGAMLMVTEADNSSMIGSTGVVVLETRNTLQLVTKEDKYLVIPKGGSVFQTAFRGKILTLFGDAMRSLPSARGRKAKRRAPLPFSLR